MKRYCSIQKWLAVFLCTILITTLFLPVTVPFSNEFTANAASVDYPVQLMNIATKDGSAVLTENGIVDGATISAEQLGSDLACAWRFDRVGSDTNGTFFKLVNAQSGRLMTPHNYTVSSGSSVIVYGSESAQSQHWYVIPVQNDRLGNALYYKIVNYSDTSLALTQSSSGMSLETYSGADNQLWLLNADGLQGFAGYCFDDNTGSIKAADIGGLFGETVSVSTFDELKKYATSDTPYTIVVTQNISVTNLQMDSQSHYYCPDGRIYVHNNKTIIGSYGANQLYNVQFCTSTNNGTGNNIIIKNFDLQHDAKSNGNDSIVVYFGSGQNLWVDHVTFTGHSAVNTQGESTPDWDKFLACCYDADYCTVSDSSFGLHEYGLILGYPADDTDSYNNYNNFPRMSLIGNQFSNTITRGPGLMRYGYFHSLNNSVNTFSMAYTVHTACKIFAESCYYDGGSINGNVVCDWNSVTYPGSYAESGSVFVNCKRTTIEGYAQNCSWRPSSNYTYTALSAEEAKSYCASYAGCQSSNTNMMYLRFASKGVPSAGYTEAPSISIEDIEPINGKLIQNLKVVDLTTYTNWAIDTDIAQGDLVFGDRDVTYAALPQALIGAEAILTACDAKYTTTDLATFTAAQSMNVYIALDSRVTTVPSWLLDYTKTNLTATNSTDVVFHLYQKHYDAGDMVTLGSNGQSESCVNYTVFAALPLGDVNADGSLSIADVIMLQKWLLCSGDITDWEAGDLYKDDQLNALDLCFMKRLLMNG